MTYSFTFDATFCSGCKACQAACKDKNNLPVGVLWRRVYEVSGGAWQKEGEAWHNTVFAYNLSIACNHCIHPKCAGVCPTNAYQVREDGIVILDTSKCMGCGYCAWACPYGVPQYHPEAGVMTKCNLCFDNLEQGLSPACVAACPMRALDYQDVPEGGSLTDNRMKLWQFSAGEHPFPLPAYSRTQPRLAIRPHPAMKTAAEKTIANHEEIQPRPPSKWEEAPLIAFTLLVQMAVGMYGMMTLTSFPLFPSLLVGLCLAAGMFAAFTHLGNKKNAWRAMGQLGRSRISDEIFSLILFSVGWLTTMALIISGFAPEPGVFVITTMCGGYLIHNMAEVYRLPAATRWNTRRTNLGFLASTLLLGSSAMAIQWVRSLPGFWIIANSLTLILLLLQLGLLDRESYRSPWRLIRTSLLSLGAILALMNSLRLFSDPVPASALLLLVVLVEETIGRWLFYRFRTEHS